MPPKLKGAKETKSLHASKGYLYVTSSPNGRAFITASQTGLFRRFEKGLSNEPISIDVKEEDDIPYSITASNKYFSYCTDNGEVNIHLNTTGEFVSTILRQTLSIREVDFSPDGEWIASACDENSVKIVNINDITKIITIDHDVSVNHVSYNPIGTTIATTSADGIVRFFSISSQDPELIRSIPDITPKVNKTDFLIAGFMEDGTENDELFISSKLKWHPDGNLFALPSKSHDIMIFSINDYKPIFSFENGHHGSITDHLWSPSGKLYASISLNDNILNIWNVETHEIHQQYECKNGVSIAWSKNNKEIYVGTKDGTLLFYDVEQLQTEDNKFIDGEANESGSETGDDVNKEDTDMEDAAGGIDGDDLDGWIEDDDHAGYIPNLAKRDRDEIDVLFGQGSKKSKRQNAYTTINRRIHECFQPGSTPWKNQRRYLTMNYLGYCWSVDQDDHFTITVNFFDRDLHREYHFQDYASFDLASLTEDACLFACSGKKKDGNNPTILYRKHEGINDNWEIIFEDKLDKILSIALSSSMVFVCTEKGYVYTYNTFGIPLGVYRQAQYKIVSCIAFNDIFFSVRSTQSGDLVYQIENCNTERIYQKNDTLDIPTSGYLKSLFFSTMGDPCIYDSNGVLLVLSHWRHPLQARWIPLLDTTQMIDRKDKNESYWPLGLNNDKFICIILKSGDGYPVIPLPIPNEFDIKIPIVSITGNNESETNDRKTLEENYMRGSILTSLIEDLVGSKDWETNREIDGEELRGVLTEKQFSTDKVLLRLIQYSCSEGKSAKVLALAQLLGTTKGLEAAGKIALRFELSYAANKINEILEQRMDDE